MLAAVVMVATLVLALRAHSVRRATRKPTVTAAAEPAALLQLSDAPLQPKMTDAPPSGVDLTPAPSASVGPIVREGPPSPKQTTPESTVQERREYADAMFDTQAYDRNWAIGAERELADQLRNVDLNAKSSCRQDLCRVEFEGSEDESKKKVENFVRLGKWNVMVTHVEQGARTSVKMYLTKGLTPLPEPDLMLADSDSQSG